MFVLVSCMSMPLKSMFCNNISGCFSFKMMGYFVGLWFKQNKCCSGNERIKTGHYQVILAFSHDLYSFQNWFCQTTSNGVAFIICVTCLYRCWELFKSLLQQIHLGWSVMWSHFTYLGLHSFFYLALSQFFEVLRRFAM